MILSKYIRKEINHIFLAVAAVLLVISISNKFVLYLSKAALGQLPAAWVAEIICLLVPEVLSQILPLSLFFAILFSHSRFYTDGEYTAMVTGGFGANKIVKVTMLQALGVAFLVAILTFWVVPDIMSKREQVIAEGETAAIWQAVLPGRFQTIDEGRQVFYVEDASDDDENYNRVFLAQMPNQKNNKTSWTVITADKGELLENDNQAYMVLENGNRYNGEPGQLNFSAMEFSKYGRKIDIIPAEVPDYERLQSSLKLLKSNKVRDKVELLWRLSLPISVLVLAVYALGFAKVAQRQGRFAKLIPGIFIYILYFNFMTVARRNIMAENAGLMQLWAVHFVFLTLGILLLLQTMGKLQKIKPWLSGKLK